ncbi:hypothetical protein N665_0018s0012 [Sinapis alba]|nr:hypothetical protein N665_0018s0012 [Sinapis alba]
MDTNNSFVILLSSQCSVDLDSPEPTWFSSQAGDDAGVKERRKWTPKEDKILIGVWLNTSKDPVKRIQDYYNSSPLLVGTVLRESVQCKQRWSRINDQVCKFVGCYGAALREQRSGQNDDDVMKAALDFFNNDYGIKFTLEHAWRELRHDNKWASTFVGKESVKDKRKQAPENVEGEGRPIGVKAAKAATKKKKSDRLLAKKEPLTEMKTSLKLKLMSDML